MQHTRITRLAVALCGAGLLGLSVPAAALQLQSPFGGLFVIGDSLSDDGNLYALTGNTFPPAPYYQGRLSNGPVAVEYLAAGLGLAGTPAYVNLAIAGAQTGQGGQINNTGMLAQTAGLLGASPVLPSNALYVVWGGANDLRGGVSIGTAVGNLVSIVSQLHTAGARSFLLPNLPDLGLTPEAREAGGSALATAASEAFNTALASAYGTLASTWTDETFYSFNAMAAQRAITNGSPANGFTNVSERCFDARDSQAITLCAAPDTYLYWDNIHPTAAAHAILGAEMLAAVPEPQTMLLMAVGVVALLALGRRRHGAAAAAGLAA